MSTSVNGVTTSSANKKLLMREFICTVRDYNHTNSEEASSSLGRILQELVVPSDGHIFEPNSSVVNEFYGSLYELLSCLNKSSPLIWHIVNVLQQACKNRSARKTLVHTYHFIPVLSRFFEDSLTRGKKRHLLGIMQELTYGIKISWDIYYLPSVLETLVKWIETGDEKVVSVALGVLLNMCHGNMPVVYALMRTTNIKQFLRRLLNMRSALTEVQVCKLLLTLDQVSGDVPDTDVINFVRIAFKRISDAFDSCDVARLRHIVEFFCEVRVHPRRLQVVQGYERYSDDVARVLDVLEKGLEANQNEADSDKIKSDTVVAECIAILYEFLRSLVELEIPEVRVHYARMVALALRNTRAEVSGPFSLSLLTSVALEAPAPQDLEPLVRELPTFLKSVERDLPRGNWPQITEHIRLLHATAQHKCLLPSLSDAVDQDFLSKLFNHLSNAELEGAGHDAAHQVYVYTLSILTKLEQNDNHKWHSLLVELLANRQLQGILARVLMQGSKETRSIVLQLVANNRFLIQDLSKRLCEADVPPAVENAHPQDAVASLAFPVITAAQMQQLDQAITRINEAHASSELRTSAISELLELYEYRMATMKHAERVAQNNLEAANKYAAHLQQRVAHMSVETARLDRLLFHFQQCHQDAQDRLKKTHSSVTKLSEQLSEKTKLSEQQQEMIRSLEAKLSEKLQDLGQVTKKCEDHVAKNKALIKASVALEENLNKMQKSIEEKDEVLAKSNSRIETLAKQIENLELKRVQNEKLIAKKEKDLADTIKELDERNKILETITRISSSGSLR